MQKSLGILTAGVLAYTGYGVEVEAKAPTYHSRYYKPTGYYSYDRHYDYGLDEKVDATLDWMLADLDDQKEWCLKKALALVEEIEASITYLREELSQAASDRADSSISTLQAKYNELVAHLDATLVSIKEAIEAAKGDYNVKIEKLLKETKYEISQLRFGYGGYGYHLTILADHGDDKYKLHPGADHFGFGGYPAHNVYAQTELKPEPEPEYHVPDVYGDPYHSSHDDGYHSIHAIVEKFNEALEFKSASFDAFIEEKRQYFAHEIHSAKADLANLGEHEISAYDEAAAAAEAKLSAAKHQKRHSFDEFVKAKQWQFAQNVHQLKNDFKGRFLWALKKTGNYNSYHQKLLWKAVEQKSEFFGDVWAISKELDDGFAAKGEQLSNHFADEWQALLDALEANRNRLVDENVRLNQALWDHSDALQHEFEEFAYHVGEWFDKRILWAQKELKTFLHGYNGYLNYFPYQTLGYFGRGYGCPHIGHGGYAGAACGHGYGYGTQHKGGAYGHGGGYLVLLD